MEFIPLSEVLHHIDSGERFDMDVVTCDVKRGTGGAVRSFRKHVKFVSQKLTVKESAKAATLTDGKHPSHFQNSTRNIYDPQERTMRKVHIRLIVRFNGKLVS